MSNPAQFSSRERDTIPRKIANLAEAPPRGEDLASSEHRTGFAKMAARGANARKKAKRRRHAKSRKAAVEAAATASQDRAQPRGR